MRVVVAPDSFKGSLEAAAAAAAMARGIGTARPDVAVVVRPLADGGEGTAAALAGVLGGRWIRARVTGPLGRPLDARWLHVDGDGGTAVVETAAASGLALLDPGERDPLRATTRGTGELLAAASAAGVATVLLGLGGSATVDGGTGAGRALGWRFLDRAGREVTEGGGSLARIRRIVPPDPHPLTGIRVRALHDVETPLVGPHGAARVFGPQKGADADAVARLEEGLAHLAGCIAADLGLDLARGEGTGAAGGLGAGAVAFLGAELVPGAEAVADAVDLDRTLAGADRVVTGEGRFDATSLRGKVVGAVAARARRAGIPVSVLAGSVAPDVAGTLPAGIDEVRSAAPADLPESQAMARADELLEAAAARLARGWPEPPPLPPRTGA